MIRCSAGMPDDFGARFMTYPITEDAHDFTAFSAPLTRLPLIESASSVSTAAFAASEISRSYVFFFKPAFPRVRLYYEQSETS